MSSASPSVRNASRHRPVAFKSGNRPSVGPLATEVRGQRTPRVFGELVERMKNRKHVGPNRRIVSDRLRPDDHIINRRRVDGLKWARGASTPKGGGTTGGGDRKIQTPMPFNSLMHSFTGRTASRLHERSSICSARRRLGTTAAPRRALAGRGRMENSRCVDAGSVSVPSRRVRFRLPDFARLMREARSTSSTTSTSSVIMRFHSSC